MSTHPNEGQRRLERREVMKAAAAFAGALAALGISSDDWSSVSSAEAQPARARPAASKPRPGSEAANPRLAAEALRRAFTTQDMARAIRETAGLTDAQKRALGQLSATDLRHLAAVQRRVQASLGDGAADTGYVFW